MRRVVVFVALLLAGGAPIASAPAAAQAPPAPTAPAPPPAKAWIVVDADSGRVIDASNEREPLPPASVSKLVTALAAVAHLPADAPVPVSPLTAEAPPNKLNMQAGEVWTLTDTLHSLLLSSANDAAAAIGEAVSGSLEAFPERMVEIADRLGLEDAPVLWDPAGLDDATSVAGGNRLSARDVAIVARAVLAEPVLAAIVATPEYHFVDPGGEPHRLRNHNKLLARYPGAIGMKTGYTRRAGHCLASAATRDGRTAIAVVLGATDMYGLSASLLDRALAAPAGAGTGDVLPPVRSVHRVAETSEQTVPLHVATASERSEWALQPVTSTWPGRAFIGGTAGVVALRLRARRRIARRRRRAPAA